MTNFTKKIEKKNLKTFALEFDTEFEEDALVFEFITNSIPRAIRGTEWKTSEFVVQMLYETIQNRIKKGEVKLTRGILNE